jgi:hypothetical protein
VALQGRECDPRAIALGGWSRQGLAQDRGIWPARPEISRFLEAVAVFARKYKGLAEKSQLKIAKSPRRPSENRDSLT